MTQAIGLGDIVSLQFAGGGYETATVCQVHQDGTFDVFRPYVHTADFSYGGGEEGDLQVICYIGTETLKRLRSENVKLIQKRPVPR